MYLCLREIPNDEAKTHERIHILRRQLHVLSSVQGTYVHNAAQRVLTSCKLYDTCKAATSPKKVRYVLGTGHMPIHTHLHAVHFSEQLRDHALAHAAAPTAAVAVAACKVTQRMRPPAPVYPLPPMHIYALAAASADMTCGGG